MMKTYKELQATAKVLGIKANQKYEVLALELERHADALNEYLPTTLTEDDIDKMFSTVEEERSWDSANEVSAIDTTFDDIEVIVPLFEFVRADNCVVVFNQKGVQVTVGWSKKNFCCWMQKEGAAPKPMMVQSAINIFKAYINGRDGDVAQIVKALTRIRRKPSIITAMETKSKAQLILSTPPRRRNAFMPIDPEWLKEYRATDNYDAKFVREDYEIHLLALESRGELY